jgi:threonine dehydratase
LRLVAEGAGAVGIAALLTGKVRCVPTSRFASSCRAATIDANF